VRRFALAAILATWIPLLGAPILRWWDFTSFYAAGRLAFTPEVLDVKTMMLLQQNLGLPINQFIYPPAFAILYAPLSALPYNLAGLINLVLMGLAYLLAIRLGAHLLKIPLKQALVAALAWAPAGASVATGQNATLLLLLFVIGLGTTTLVAPARLAILYKPQLGLPVLGALFLRRPRYGALLLLVGGALDYFLSVLATGGNFSWPLDWLSSFEFTRSTELATNGWQSMSMSGAFAHALGPQFEILGYVAAVGLVLVSLRALRRADQTLALALALALAIVISPHSHIYDAVLLLPLLALIWRRSLGDDSIKLAMVLTYIAALLWIAKPLWPVQPLLVVALGWIVYVLRTPRLWTEVPPLSLEPVVNTPS
jgi:hypothetical protein